MNYKKRCKDCCYMFILENTHFLEITTIPNGEWCCECYEKLCKEIKECPQNENYINVKFKY